MSPIHLPFGKSSAVRNDDVNSFYDMASKVTTTLEAYEPLGQKKVFSHQSAFVGISDLSLMASTSTPVRYQVSDDHSHYFILPFKGEASCAINNKQYLSSARNGAMVIPGAARSGTTTDLSMLQATLNSSRLAETARVMLGNKSNTAINDLIRKPLLLSMQSGQIRFDQVFERMCALIDDLSMSFEALSKIGFDDFFYRTLSSWIFQAELLSPDALLQTPPQKTLIDQVCDYVDAHLTETIYLTSLEKIANLSARSLQYAFLKRFGCSPMAWVQERRLQLAHEHLLRADPEDSVTQIATSCGFTNLGRFSLCYRQKYGEIPSATLKRLR